MTTTAATMPWGKHKGTPLHKLPPSYITWLLSDCTNLPASLRRQLGATLTILLGIGECDRCHLRHSSYCGQCAREVAKLASSKPPGPDYDHTANFAERWLRKMAMKFHPDRGGNTQSMAAVNAGFELLRELAKSA